MSSEYPFTMNDSLINKIRNYGLLYVFMDRPLQYRILLHRMRQTSIHTSTVDLWIPRSSATNKKISLSYSQVLQAHWVGISLDEGLSICKCGIVVQVTAKNLHTIRSHHSSVKTTIIKFIVLHVIKSIVSTASRVPSFRDKNKADPKNGFSSL